MIILIVTGILSTGTSFAAVQNFDDDVLIPPLSKLFLDSGSNTYLSETATDRIDFVAGGLTKLRINGGTGDVEYLFAGMTISPTKRLFLDGGGNTYLVEQFPDVMNFVTGGLAGLQIDGSQNVVIFETKKLYLDGGANDYITSSGDVISIVAAGTETIRVTNGDVDILNADLSLNAGDLFTDGGDLVLNGGSITSNADICIGTCV